MAKVLLETKEEDGVSLSFKMLDLMIPLSKGLARWAAFNNVEYLFLNHLQRVWAIDREAYAEYVSIWVAQRSQPVIIFLACRVP